MTRFFKYLKDNKFEGLDIQVVKQIESQASHAALLGISTKQTTTVIGIGESEKKMKYGVSFIWVHKDAYSDANLEGLVHVGLEILDMKEPHKTKVVASKSFDLGKSGTIKNGDKNNKKYSNILDKYLELATDFFWDTPNSIKFIKD